MLGHALLWLFFAAALVIALAWQRLPLAALGLSQVGAASLFWAALLFALLHLPFWGAGAVVALTLTSAALTALFLWRNDLVANAIAHAIMDANAFVLAPLQAKRAARRSLRSRA